jgi:hypothetical protein
MSNEQTPMKKLKHFTDTLTNLLEPKFKTLRLNKSRRKYNPNRYGTRMSGYSLGVDSDHIVIFKDQKSDASFGIVFNYIGKSIEKWTYQLTYKEFDIPCKNKDQSFLNDDKRVNLSKTILFSDELELADFKCLLKSLIDQLEKNKGDVSDLVFSFVKKEISGPSCIDGFNKELSYSIKKMSIVLKPQTNDLRVFERLSEASDIVIEDNRSNVDSDMLKLESYQLVSKLTKELLAAESSLAIDMQNIREKYNIKKLNSDDINIKLAFLDAQKDLIILTQAEINKSPIYLKKSLTKHFFTNSQENK